MRPGRFRAGPQLVALALALYYLALRLAELELFKLPCSEGHGGWNGTGTGRASGRRRRGLVLSGGRGTAAGGNSAKMPLAAAGAAWSLKSAQALCHRGPGALSDDRPPGKGG